MTQTTAPAINMETAFAGLIADGMQPKDVVSKVNVVAAVLLGYLVSLGADGDDSIIAPAAAGDVTTTPIGVVMHSHAIESSPSGDPQWPIKSTPSILREGRIWVVVEDAVDAQAPAFVVHTGGDEGVFRSDVDGGNASALPGAKFVTSTTGAGLAVVELNRP